MKRLFLMVVAMLSMTMTFAENENANTVSATEAYNLTVNMDKLSQALNLTADQVESVADVHKTFCGGMMLAAAQTSADERSVMVDRAINNNLAWMRYILNDEQYKTYLMLLNVTLHNRGLK